MNAFRCAVPRNMPIRGRQHRPCDGDTSPCCSQEGNSIWIFSFLWNYHSRAHKESNYCHLEVDMLNTKQILLSNSISPKTVFFSIAEICVYLLVGHWVGPRANEVSLKLLLSLQAWKRRLQWKENEKEVSNRQANVIRWAIPFSAGVMSSLESDVYIGSMATRQQLSVSDAPKSNFHLSLELQWFMSTYLQKFIQKAPLIYSVNDPAASRSKEASQMRGITYHQTWSLVTYRKFWWMQGALLVVN